MCINRRTGHTIYRKMKGDYYCQHFQLAQTIKYYQLAHGALSLSPLLCSKQLPFACKGLFILTSECHQA